MARIVPLASALAAAAIGIVQFRHGIVPLLDTVTYWSGAEAVARGDFFTTSLAPSFSNFSALEFLARDGSLPFVDFPIGYPLLAGGLGSILGVRLAMQVLVVAALMAIAVGVAVGLSVGSRPLQSPNEVSTSDSAHRGDPPGKRSWERHIPVVLLGLVGVLLVLTPTMRLVTQGALSESLFCAAVLWLVIALARFRHCGTAQRDGQLRTGDRTWTAVVILTIAASLLRFLGTPLAVLAGWERYRRTGQVLRSVLWTGALMVPATINIVVASAAGGGHSAGWRGLNRLDIEVFIRSLGGWFDARQGDIRRTYFSVDGPSWWSWPLAALWATLIIVALVRFVLSGLAGPDRLSSRAGPLLRVPVPAVTEIALCAAGIMTVGLVAGIMGFDALVIADNRLMLPSGLLTLSALAWWFISARSPWTISRRQFGALATVAVAIWAVTAVRPWQATDMFSDGHRGSPLTQTVSNLLEGRISHGSNQIAVVISNDADAVHWETGLPSAYAPMPVKPLSGERVDEVPLYRNLPCALLRFQGVIVISNEATFSSVNLDLLDREVQRGGLGVTPSDATTVYWPTSTACTSQED